MFPCEMARYIAVFSREARKYGHFRSRRAQDIDGSGSAHDARSGPDRGLICFMFSTSERSAGTSWLPPVPVSAAAGERAAAAAVAAPDGRVGPPDAGVVGGGVVLAGVVAGVGVARGVGRVGPGPVVAGGFGVAAARLADAAPAGGVVAGDVVAGDVVVGVVVADLLAGAGFVFGVATP